MIIHRQEELPKGYGYYVSEPLSQWDFDYIKNLELDEIWYWYGGGGYEGSGQILMRKGELYDLHDCGHCSCYGPTEHIEFKGKPLNDLVKSLSEHYFKEVEQLLKMAGYESK